MPMAFLMQQMEWREELGEARAGKDGDALDALDKQLRGARKEQLAQIEQQINASDFPAAAQGVRALMFLEKFGEEVRFAFEAIEA
jgi:molecular chaperone HscB